jgi:hypothetical protein
MGGQQQEGWSSPSRAPGPGAAKLVGVVDGQDGGAGVLVEPRPGGVGGGEEVDLAAERGAN